MAHPTAPSMRSRALPFENSRLIDLEVIDYAEHAIGRGADARAAAYVQCHDGEGRTVFGVGLSPNIVTASLEALVSAANGVLLHR